MAIQDLAQIDSIPIERRRWSIDQAKPPELIKDAGPASPLWQVYDLAASYESSSECCQVLAPFSLDIVRNRVTTVIGPSGCGKSTFISCLNLLIHHIEEATITGRILMDGEDILQPGIDMVALRRKIGYIFQKPNPFPTSIWRNLELPLREHKITNRDEIAMRIEEAFTIVGLWKEVKDRLHSSATKLSGGQQQRLCIARALILRPEALLMDEPCSALDPLATSLIEELILSLRDRLTIVVVTHNLAQARRVGDDTAFFWNDSGMGYLAEAGSTEQIFSAPRQTVTQRYISGQVS